jgi:hypothetical protein
MADQSPLGRPPMNFSVTRGNPGVGSGFGCLGTVVGAIVVAAVIVAAVFAGLIILGIVAAFLVVGLLVLAVDRLLLALSPKRRERRATMQRTFLWRSGQILDPTVIDTTVIDTTANVDETKGELEP